MRDKTNNLDFSAALYLFVENYGSGRPNLWTEAAEHMNRRFKLNLAKESYRSIYARLRHKYGLDDLKRWGYIERRPLSELTEAVERLRQATTVQADKDSPRASEGNAGGEGDDWKITDDFDIIIQRKDNGQIVQPATEEELRRILKNEIDDSYGRPENGDENEPIDRELLQMLKKPRTMDEISGRFSLPPIAVEFIIERLKGEGYNIVFLDNTYRLEMRTAYMGENYYRDKWNGAETIVKGIVSDTHLGSKFQQLTALKHFYSILQERDIAESLNVGDTTDGFYKDRPEHIYETFIHGAEEQIEYVTDVWPSFTLSDGITQHKTRGIDGNHDFTHTRNSGIRSGKIIAAARKDIEYLGYGKARIMFTPNCPVDLLHPIDGKAYALSYKLQKNIDTMQGGSKPKILFVGHYHTFCYILYRNIHAIMCPCFQAQSTWASQKSLAVQVGGMIMTVKVSKDGDVLSFMPEIVPYYEMMENDY